MANEGLCGRGCLALLSSKVQTPISPSPSPDDGAHVVVVVAGEKMLLGVGLGPEYSQFLLRFLVLKVDNFLRSLSVILQHSEPYSGVGSTQLWYMIYHPTCMYAHSFAYFNFRPTYVVCVTEIINHLFKSCPQFR